jgi:hypothetical protein
VLASWLKALLRHPAPGLGRPMSRPHRCGAGVLLGAIGPKGDDNESLQNFEGYRGMPQRFSATHFSGRCDKVAISIQAWLIFARYVA